MDFSAIEHQVLEALGLLIGAALLFLIQRAFAWFQVRLSVERQAVLTAAVDKVMTFGVTKAEDIIKLHGWDSIVTKNLVINQAVTAIADKFPDALAANGLDMDNPVDRAKLIDMMTRMIPDVFARAAASPASPPVPESARIPSMTTPPAGA